VTADPISSIASINQDHSIGLAGHDLSGQTRRSKRSRTSLSPNVVNLIYGGWSESMRADLWWPSEIGQGQFSQWLTPMIQTCDSSAPVTIGWRSSLNRFSVKNLAN